jgi:IS5 family transposase
VKLLRSTCHFGAKAHIGVDSKETVVHTVVTSAASVADKHMLPDLLHGNEKKVWGDAGYQGQTEVIHAAAPNAQDMTSRRTKFKNYVDEEAKRKNTTKARVRAKVEWPFRILKRIFGFTKVRYRVVPRTNSVVGFSAVFMMEAGPPKSTCRSGLQTAVCG